MVEGPLTLRWDQRVGGLLPRVDNGAIDSSALHHPSIERCRGWARAAIGVVGRPEWIFIKLHTHGAKDVNADVLLGPPMRRFHEALAREFNDGIRYRLHYVTAREVYNIVRAAEDGRSGNAGQYRDYVLSAPPARQAMRQPRARLVGARA
jgi:hypothetical protein